MPPVFTPLKQLARALARPTLLFYALPWLMLLLVAGTIAQRYAGLYASQQLFFGSFILWIGPVPVPGAYSVLALIALSLLAKLVLDSPYETKKAGIILSHASALVLLLGGLVSALSREEGYMVLSPGAMSALVQDYRERELAVVKNDALLMAVPERQLRGGENVGGGALPFRLTVLRLCHPCKAVARTAQDADLHGVAQSLDLRPAAFQSEEAENQSGALLRVEGAGSADGTYLSFEPLASQPEWSVAGDRYRVFMRPRTRRLPFSVTLADFEKSDYPGTDMAQSYRSDVIMQAGAARWSDRIEMNKPLRYNGYTLYQSSFIDADGKRQSVLAVVKNAGAWFPYLAIATLCAGLGLHVLLMAAGKRSL